MYKELLNCMNKCCFSFCLTGYFGRPVRNTIYLTNVRGSFKADCQILFLQKSARHDRHQSANYISTTYIILFLLLHEIQSLSAHSPSCIAHKLRKREDWTVRRIFFISANRPYDDQIYNCNLEISPTQVIILRNCQNWSKHSKVTSLPKTVQPL
jgi:hypothetical protein